MAKGSIGKKAEELLGFGFGLQQVFDTLVREHPDEKPKKIAEVVRYLPTRVGREQYNHLHRALLAAIVLHGLLRVLRPMLEPDFDWAVSYRLVSLVPIATVLLGYSIYRWQGQVFEWVGWMNLLGAPSLLKALAALGNGPGDPWEIGLNALTVGIGALALFLARRVFPKYEVVKEPRGVAPPRYVFPPEPGMYRM